MARTTSRRNAVAILLALLLLLGGVFAVSTFLEPAKVPGQVSQGLELSLHRRLAEVRRTPGVEMTPFVTDGCSGGMSSLWVFTAERFPAFAEVHDDVPPWEACCIAHDRAYHNGGTDADPAASYAARIAADEELRQCVVAKSFERSDVLQQVYGLEAADIRQLYEAVAAAMYHAVRLGGQPCSGLPWRWGYGYPGCGDAPAE
jgi:hypothetical protein